MAKLKAKSGEVLAAIHIEVTENTVKGSITGSSDQLLTGLVNVMSEDPRVLQLFTEATKKAMIMALVSKTSKAGDLDESSLAFLLQEMMAGAMRDDSEDDSDETSDKPAESDDKGSEEIPASPQWKPTVGKA